MESKIKHYRGGGGDYTTNSHLVFVSQKSKLTLLELIFQTAGAINPPSPLSLIVLREENDS